MESLVRLARRESTAGPSLSTTYRCLDDEGLSLRPGELHLVTATAGSLKSTLLLNILYRGQYTALYFSADTRPKTVYTRMATMVSNYPDCYPNNKDAVKYGDEWPDHTMYQVSQWYQDDPERLVPYLRKGGRNIQWCFEEAPTMDSIQDELNAYAEVHGCYPQVVVVDNLMDVDSDHPDEYAGMKETMKALKTLAARTDAAVVVLHHINESSKFDPTVDQGAPARKDITGKVSHGSSLIFTMHYNRPEVQGDTGRLLVAPVKNREGKDDPSGNWVIALDADPEHQLITDPQHEEIRRAVPAW